MPIADATEIGELSPKTFARFAQFITGELGIRMPSPSCLWFRAGCFAGFGSCD
jgi:hypothetical protein